MKISTKGRYALRMLLDLAQHQNDGYVALKDIARRQNVSKKYLEQIVPMLNKSDILLAFCATAVQTASRCPCGRGSAAPSTNTSTASPCRIY